MLIKHWFTSPRDKHFLNLGELYRSIVAYSNEFKTALMHKYRVDSWNIILDMMENGNVHCAKAFLVSIKLLQMKGQGKRWEDLLEWIMQVKAKDLNDTQIPEHLNAIVRGICTPIKSAVNMKIMCHAFQSPESGCGLDWLGRVQVSSKHCCPIFRGLGSRADATSTHHPAQDFTNVGYKPRGESSEYIQASSGRFNRPPQDSAFVEVFGPQNLKRRWV